MKGIEKFRDDMPWTVTTELIIYQGHRYKKFGYWDSRTAKGAATRLTKVLRRAEKIFDKGYVRPDQLRDHLKKISFAVAEAPSWLTRQLDAFGLDLQHLVKLALKMDATHIHICLIMVIWLLEDHELWRSPNNAILHILGSRQFSDRMFTQIDKAINEDPDAEWVSILDPTVLTGLVGDLEAKAEEMLRRNDKRAENGVRKAFEHPAICQPVFSQLDSKSIFEKTAIELWETIQNVKEWDAIERLYLASTTANVNLGIGFAEYLERDHFKLWSLIFPKQENEDDEFAEHSRQDFGSWIRRKHKDEHGNLVEIKRRDLTPAEWVHHCAIMRDCYQRVRLDRRTIYERPSGSDTPVGVTPKSKEDPRAFSSEAMTMDLDQQMQTAALNESQDDWLKQDAVAEMEREAKRKVKATDLDEVLEATKYKPKDPDLDDEESPE